jgi:hypothetical protein
MLYIDRDDKLRRFKIEERPVENKGSLACTKMVFGAAFSGYPANRCVLEEAAVDEFVKQAQANFELPSHDTDVRRKALHEGAEHVVKALERALKSEADKYLDHIVKVLLSPKFQISWNPVRNNCQRLVDQLLQGKDFEYFFPRLPKDPGSSDVQWPQYLMSFNDRVCNDSISLQQPNSMLSKFLSHTIFIGDLIDSLRSQFEGRNSTRNYPALLLQEEAATSKEQRVEMSNALWEMPHDTFSILQFHYCRSRLRYTNKDGQPLTQDQWMENRLLLFLLSDVVASMSGALGSSLLDLFRSSPSLVSKVILPKARVMGTTRAGEQVRIIKMLGEQAVYFISSDVDAELEALFKEPEKIKTAVEIVNSALQDWVSKGLTFNSVISKSIVCIARTSGLLKRRKRQAKRGFKSVVNSPMGAALDKNFLYSAIIQSIRAYEIGRRDGWFHYTFDGFTMVMQLFRKSKVVRK